MIRKGLGVYIGAWVPVFTLYVIAIVLTLYYASQGNYAGLVGFGAAYLLIGVGWLSVKIAQRLERR